MSGSFYDYGIEAEEKLIEVISDILEEPITKTVKKWDTMDFLAPSSFSELKRRSSEWFYCDEKIEEEGWLVPACKVIRGWDELSKGKRVFFFYFWMRDKSLWKYEMKEGDFTSVNDYCIPKNHYDKQLHVKIHQSRWTRVECDLSMIVFDEETCLIE